MRTRLLAAFAAVAAAAVPTHAAPGGAVWAPTIQSTQAFDHLSAFPDGTFYAQYLDTYARSRDFGKTWEPMARPPHAYANTPGIRFATPSVGWSVTDGTGEDLVGEASRDAEEVKACGGLSPLHRTTDGGTTWTYVCVPNAGALADPQFHPGVSPLGVGRDGRTVTLLGTEQPRTSPAGACGIDANLREVVYTTRDAGAHWARAVVPKGWTGGYRVQVHDASTIGFVAYRFDTASCASTGSGVFVSRDGGRTFRLVRTDLVPDNATSFAFVTRTRMVVGLNDGRLLLTDDGGAHWRRGQRLFDAKWQPLIDQGQVDRHWLWAQALSFANARVGFASTRGSGTWRTTDGGVSWRQERSPECAYFMPGVGEIAAGSADTAVTGGPHLISARVATPGDSGGCAGTSPQITVGPVATFATPYGTGSVAPDGSLRLR